MRRALSLLFSLALLGGVTASQSPELAFTLEIGELQREGIIARDLQIRLHQRSEGLRVQAHIAELQLPQLDEPLRGISFDCPNSSASWPQLQCEQASAQVAQSPWGPQQLNLSINWQESAASGLVFDGFKLGGSVVSGALTLAAGNWQLKAQTPDLRLQRLTELAAFKQQADLRQLDGRLKLDLQVDGNADGLQRLSAKGRLRSLDFSDVAGARAGQGLEARFSISAHAKGEDWQGALQLNLGQGEWYTEPLFLDFAAQPLQLVAEGRWQTAREQLVLRQLLVELGQVLKLNGNLQLALDAAKVQQGELRLELASLEQAYPLLAQPWLIGTALDDLLLSGQGGLRLAWQGGALQALDLGLSEMDLVDRHDAFGAYGLQAQVAWRAEGDAPSSELHLAGASLGGLQFGAAKARFNASGPAFYLLEPLRLPFYQGHIEVGELTWLQLAQGADAGFSLAVDGVSLQALSNALGWPEMRGSVQASLPRARYLDERLAVQGDIRIQAFDGQLLLRQLVLDKPLSVAPVLDAQLELRGLDLAQLTETFSFGRIQGRLDGEVRDLQLIAWQPNRFDAHLYSPPDDDLPHRISQRAVENLTELGNGVPGALSGGVLSIFNEFSYDRVELKISQRGALASIDGMPHRDGGYYLVRGAGLPRIDVIGRNRQISWDALLARLKSIRIEGVQLQ